MPASRPLRHAFIALLVLSLLAPQSPRAVEVVSIGRDGDLDWRGEGSAVVQVIDTRHRSPLNANDLLLGNAPGNLVEFASADHPGGILPRRVQEGENVAVGTVARGGGIRAPNVFDFSGTFSRLDLQMALEELLASDPGGELLAFERKNFNSLGILVIVDLGARFGVEKIRFYPRNSFKPSPSTPFQNDFLRAYELFLNDGLNLTKEGTQIWVPLKRETDNKDPVVEVRLDPPRFVQSIRLRATSPVSFEIDEFEVFGTGFLATARYISDIYDAGQPAVWGALRWVEEVIGDPQFASLQIRTRTGTDPTPFVFTRKLAGKRDAEEIPFSLEDPNREMDLDEYKSLPRTDSQGRLWEAGPVKDDLVNWSPFSTPYPASAANGPGLPISSPSPRRYLQFQVLFETEDLQSSRALEALAFELLTPPFADEVVGEVFPREVDVSRSISFTYGVRATMSTAGLRGFDTIQINTPLRVDAIDGVEIWNRDGERVAEHTFSNPAETATSGDFRIAEVGDERFAVRFPRIVEDGSLVLIRFRSGVLTYSTNFNASAQLSSEPGAAQVVVPGDAASLDPEDDPNFSGTTVLSPTILGDAKLVNRMEVSPNPFTPNGDGVNERLGIFYNLLSLSAPRPVHISIYDLGGRRVRQVHAGTEVNGRYTDKFWDGRDDGGERVPPGLYIVRLEVEGDSRQQTVSRVVGVAY